MVDPLYAAFLALDLLCATLTGMVAFFFLRMSRAFPGRGHGVLAAGFGIGAVSYLTVATSIFGLGRAFLGIDAIRAAGILLGTLLIFLNYTFRRFRAPMPTLSAVSGAVSLVAGVFIGLYVLSGPGGAFSLPPAMEYIPWFRTLEFFLLVGSALLVAESVRPRSLRDYRVPLAFLLLALDRYTVALALFHGPPYELSLQGILLDTVFSYTWRVLGLLLLLTVVMPPLRRWFPAEA